MIAAQVNGTIYEVDASGPAGAVVAPALLTAAKGDLTTAISDAAGRTPVPSGPNLNPGVAFSTGYDIGGMTLAPGLYKFGTGQTAFIETDVTLMGGPDDVWIFQCGADLQVASGVHVILAGGAQARNIFWQVSSSATIGTFAVFKGTIMANQTVVMDTSSTMEGRAMSFSTGVTFNGDSGSLPTPEGPIFTSISRTTTSSATVVLSTSPYFLLTLQACPDLTLHDWTTVTTDTPVTSPWTFTDITATANVTQRFYRAFITNP